MQRQEVEFRIGQGWRKLPEGFRESEAGRTGSKLIKRFRELAQELVVDAATVRRDIDLSDIGRERRLFKLGSAARLHPKLERSRQRWRDARLEREEFLLRLVRKATSLDPPEGAFAISLDTECRTYLREQEPERRLETLDQALRKGDTTPLRAVLTAPPFLSGLSDKEADNLRHRAASVLASTEAHELETLARAGDLVLAAEKSFDRIVDELTHDAGSPLAPRA